MRKHRVTLIGLVCLLLSVALPGHTGLAQAASAPASSSVPEVGTSGPSGATLLRSDHQGIETLFTAPNFEIVDEIVAGETCQRIITNGQVADAEPGHPQLPYRTALIGVPAGVTLSLSATPMQSVTLPGRYFLCPAKEGDMVSDSKSGVDLDAEFVYVEREVDPDSNIYGSNTFFPAQIGQVENLGQMRSQSIARLAVSPFQYNPITGELRLHHQVQVIVEWPQVLTSAGVHQVQESSVFEKAFAGALINYDSARTLRAGPELSAAAGTAPDFWQVPESAYRVLVEDEGMYEISQTMLAAAGLPVSSLDPRSLRMYENGAEIEISVTGESDGRLDQQDVVRFYGRPINTRYTGTNVYWLSHDGTNGKRMNTATTQTDAGPVASEPHQEFIEENFTYASALPKREGYDHWYGRQIDVVGDGVSRGQNYPVIDNHVATDGDDGTVTVGLMAFTYGTHHVRLYVNNQQFYEDDSWQRNTYNQISTPLPAALLNNGLNTFKIEITENDPDRKRELIYVDWLNVDYPRMPVAISDALKIDSQAGGGNLYTVTGFASSDIQVYDVTDHAAVSIVSAQSGARTVGSTEATVSFVARNDVDSTYMAVSSDGYLTPLGVEAADPQNLVNPGVGADYIIIAHSDFIAAAQPLVVLRASQGMRTMLIDVQDVYDQFGYGRLSAEAIRDFLAHTLTNWPAPAPSDVLLLGDGTYDIRKYLDSSSDTYIPPFLVMVDPDIGETASDHRFVMLTGNDLLPDMNIGRLPANSVAETTAMVDKIVTYETQAAPGDWNKNLVFVSDDLDGGGGQFYNFSNNIADGTIESVDVPIVPDYVNKTKIYLGETCVDEDPSVQCRQQIVDEINDGALFLSYVGHGFKDGWAREALMDTVALQDLDNASKLPVILAMTCLEGYFHQPDRSTLAESLVRADGQGAVASWSPTGQGLATGHDLLEQGFLISVFHEDISYLGAATTQGKLYLIQHAPAGKYRDLIDTFLLIGDPAMKINMPAADYEVYLPLAVR